MILDYLQMTKIMIRILFTALKQETYIATQAAQKGRLLKSSNKSFASSLKYILYSVVLSQKRKTVYGCDSFQFFLFGLPKSKSNVTFKTTDTISIFKWKILPS